jgi:MFS family permease
MDCRQAYDGRVRFAKRGGCAEGSLGALGPRARLTRASALGCTLAPEVPLVLHAVSRADPYAALRFPNFRRYITGLLALTVSIHIQGTIVGWQVYDLTGDPLALGLIGLAEALPFMVSALWSGHVADRYDRRRVVLWSMGVLVGCSLGLLGLSLMTAAPTFWRVAGIYGVIIVSGVARAFLHPARQALGAELIPRAVYPNAITWRTTTWQASAVLGPALGGLLYAVGGPALAYGLDTVLMLVGMAWLFRVRHVSPTRPPVDGPMVQSLLSGIRFVRREKRLLGAMTLDLFAVLFGGATALLPIFAKDILDVGPTGLGLLRAMPAVGAVTMSIVLVRWPITRRVGRAMLWAIALYGVSMLGFALSETVWISCVMLACAGCFDMVGVVVRSTLLTVVTPEHMLGRVSAVNSVFVGSANEIGAFESGVTAKLLGTVNSVLFGGIATLGVVAWVGRAFPALRRMDGWPEH